MATGPHEVHEVSSKERVGVCMTCGAAVYVNPSDPNFVFAMKHIEWHKQMDLDRLAEVIIPQPVTVTFGLGGNR